MKSLFIPGADGHHSSRSQLPCQKQQLTGLLGVVGRAKKLLSRFCGKGSFLSRTERISRENAAHMANLKGEPAVREDGLRLVTQHMETVRFGFVNGLVELECTSFSKEINP